MTSWGWSRDFESEVNDDGSDVHDADAEHNAADARPSFDAHVMLTARSHAQQAM